MPINKIIALDVGGSSVKSGLVEANQVSQLKTTAVDSAADADSIISTFTEVILSFGIKPAGIAVGFPGPFDYENGVCFIHTKKYDSLYKLNVKHALQEKLELDVPMIFRNDAECAIVGEAIYGAGKTYKRLLGVTLGTGFGSAFVIDGEPQTSGKGIPENGWLYDDLWRGEKVDDVFSTRGLKARLAAVGFQGQPKDAVAKAGHSPEIQQVFATWGGEMGLFLRQHTEAFKPDAVLILGGLAKAYDFFGQALIEKLNVRVLRTQLDRKAALLGAAEKLKSRLR